MNGEPVGLEFFEDGRLAYVVLSGGKTQIMRLTYRVDGDGLVMDQPSSPREERSAFRVDADTLTMSFAGVPYQFQRQR